MICADVQSLARAAPEPAAIPRISTGNAENSFDQFLDAVKTSDRPTRSDYNTRTKSSVSEKSSDDRAIDQERTVDQSSRETKTAAENKVNEKPTEAAKPDKSPTEQNQQTESVDETMQEVIASAVAAQIAAVAAPVQQVNATVVSGETVEAPVQGVAVPVLQEQQSAVIQLPDTEPQPLPDELKQAIQQPKVETKDFQSLVDTASQNLEKQAATPEARPVATVQTTPVVEAPGAKILDMQETAVKVVDLTAQPEDLVELEPSRVNTGLYATASTRAENLVQQQPLPIIQKVSAEMTQLVREQGQTMRIQIHPENLGKIDLKLVSNSDGLKVVMTAEVPATAKLLENHLDQLQRQLANAGVSISGMSVNSQGAQGQFSNPLQPQSNDVPRVSIPDFQQDVETTAVQAVTVSSSSLDYRV